MFPKRNVGLIPFAFTRAGAGRIAARLIAPADTMLHAAWYWWQKPIDGVNERPAYTRPAPDGIAVWTSRGVLVIALRFTWGQHWIADAYVVCRYPSGEALPVLVTSEDPYDSATIHGETLWFAHGCVPSGFA